MTESTGTPQLHIGDVIHGYAPGRAPENELTTGSIEKIEQGGWLEIGDSEGRKWWIDRGRPIDILTPAGRQLVGPVPKVESPVYVAPFKAIGSWVLDETGRDVLVVSSSGGPTADEAERFAVYVAEALNARAFPED